jgi:hypothetical protein
VDIDVMNFLMAGIQVIVVTPVWLLQVSSGLAAATSPFTHISSAESPGAMPSVVVVAPCPVAMLLVLLLAVVLVVGLVLVGLLVDFPA